MLQKESTLIEFQEERHVDRSRPKEYTNTYTLAKLFPDEPPKDIIRRELARLGVQDYIETVKDTRYPRRSEFWVFGKQYEGNDVYIKLRVEVVGKDYIFVMSFHCSTIPFTEVDFPFAQKGGN